MSACLSTCSNGQLLELAQGNIQFNLVYLQGWKFHNVSEPFFSSVFDHLLVKLKEKKEIPIKNQ